MSVTASIEPLSFTLINCSSYSGCTEREREKEKGKEIDRPWHRLYSLEIKSVFSNASEVINKWLLMIPLLLPLRPAISTTLESFQRSKRCISFLIFGLIFLPIFSPEILGHYALCVSLFSITCHFEFEILLLY